MGFDCRKSLWQLLWHFTMRPEKNRRSDVCSLRYREMTFLISRYIFWCVLRNSGIVFWCLLSQISRYCSVRNHDRSVAKFAIGSLYLVSRVGSVVLCICIENVQWIVFWNFSEISGSIFSFAALYTLPIQNFVTNATRIAAGTKPSIYKESNFTNTYKANGKFPTMPNPMLFSNIHHSHVYDENRRFVKKKLHRSFPI